MISVSRRALLASAVLPLLGCDKPAAIAGAFTGSHPERGHLLRERRTWPAPSVTRRTQIVIAGGGVAGLAAARALRLRGIDDFALLELEDSAGGNSRAGEVAGIACPLGAHYLPVPGDAAPDVQDLLEEMGLRQRVAGRWQYDERHLCHSPQERLFFQGQWQEGLLPSQDVGPATLAQYRRFAVAVDAEQEASRFTVPASKGPLARSHGALDAMTFVAWLDREGLHDVHLRWYLDYCCRDDYGAGIDTVSAWAGIQYFASRHGFHLPDDAPTERGAVLTWPEGNGWLTRRLAAPLAGRLHAGQVVVRIAQARHGVEVDAFDPATGQLARWQAQHCVVALPVLVAARVVESPPAFLQAAAARLRYAPWVVANVHLRAPLDDRPGAAPAWDNVLHGTVGLGYVNARHQSTDQVPGPTVLTWYCAPGEASRRAMLERSWVSWREQVIAELNPAHPDLAAKAARMEVTRYGHAMVIPVPGSRAALADVPLRTGRLRFAHSDWAGYSVFEEAFTLGHVQGSHPV